MWQDVGHPLYLDEFKDIPWTHENNGIKNPPRVRIDNEKLRMGRAAVPT